MNKWFFIALFVFTACSQKKEPISNLVNEKIALIQVDKAFSQMSVEEGMKAATAQIDDVLAA